LLHRLPLRRNPTPRQQRQLLRRRHRTQRRARQAQHHRLDLHLHLRRVPHDRRRQRLHHLTRPCRVDTSLVRQRTTTTAWLVCVVAPVWSVTTASTQPTCPSARVASQRPPPTWWASTASFPST